MIHPSYVELMRVVNDDVVIGEEPVVNSRYSIVCATAKRARQLIDGDEPLHKNASIYGKKPLSIAVEELYEGDLKILTAEEADEQQHRLNELREKNRSARERIKAIEAEKRSNSEEEIAAEPENEELVAEELPENDAFADLDEAEDFPEDVEDDGDFDE